MVYKASAKWLSKRIDCTPEGIVNGCRGKCCKGISFYPSRANIKTNGFPAKYCYWLGESGCKLELQDRPIKCLLYPIVINNNNTLVLHGHALTSICKECYNKGNKSILEHQSSNLYHVFGKDIVVGMLNAVIKEGRDYVFAIPEQLAQELLIEEQLEAQNVNPIPRSKYKEL